MHGAANLYAATAGLNWVLLLPGRYGLPLLLLPVRGRWWMLVEQLDAAVAMRPQVLTQGVSGMLGHGAEDHFCICVALATQLLITGLHEAHTYFLYGAPIRTGLLQREHRDLSRRRHRSFRQHVSAWILDE